jgi:hypothetical protein
MVSGDRLVLMHRGNAREPSCALVGFDLRQLLHSIDDDDRLGRVHIESVRHYELGKVDDAPLTFTDGASLSDGTILFSAVAEQTDDNYADGPCRGAALGEIGPDGKPGANRIRGGRAQDRRPARRSRWRELSALGRHGRRRRGRSGDAAHG